MKKGIKWTYCLLMLFSAQILLAQDGQFKATCNRSEVALNQRFEVKFSVENASLKQFAPPKFEDFKVVFGPSQSTSYQIINGRTSQSLTYGYTLMPTKEGDFTIEGATGKIDGKDVKTNSVNIKVLPARTSNNQNNANSQNRNSRSQQNNTEDKSIDQQIKENLFVRVIPSKTTLYEGEQITLTYKLYYNVRLQDVQITKASKYNGFLSQDIKLGSTEGEEQTEEYNGRRYRTQIFKKDALFPSGGGSYTLDPMEFEAVVLIQKQDPFFNHPFFQTNEPYRYTFRSNPLGVTVKSLPNSGKPASFSGAVGDYTFKNEIDKTETEVGDPITYKISVTGKGNIKLVDLPKLKLPESFEVYDPKVSENVSSRSYTVNGTKEYEYLIIPRAGGDFEIPEMSFSYFNPTKGTYVEETLDAIPLTVTGGGSADQNISNGNLTKEEVNILAEDIHYLKPINKEDLHEKPAMKSATFVALFGLPFALFFLAFFWKGKQKEEEKDVVSLKMKKANKIANKRLKKAEGLLAEADDKAFYNEIVHVVWDYVSDRFNIDQSQLSKENINAFLTEKSVSESVRTRLNKLLENCELALFAPSAVSGGKPEIYHEAKDLIIKIEEELK